MPQCSPSSCSYVLAAATRRGRLPSPRDQTRYHFAELGSPAGKHCLWVDNHLQRTQAATGHYKTLLADMQRAGSRVADEWETIPPPPGFDPNDADIGS